MESRTGNHIEDAQAAHAEEARVQWPMGQWYPTLARSRAAVQPGALYDASARQRRVERRSAKRSIAEPTPLLTALDVNRLPLRDNDTARSVVHGDECTKAVAAPTVPVTSDARRGCDPPCASRLRPAERQLYSSRCARAHRDRHLSPG